jgi:hypothetical protein
MGSGVWPGYGSGFAGVALQKTSYEIIKIGEDKKWKTPTA